jgi:cytochrome c
MNEPTKDTESSEKQGISSALKYTLAITFLFTAAVAADFTMRGTRVLPEDPRFAVEGGDPERGREAILHYGCGACHTIPGIREATGRVGPQLIGLREQTYLAGVLPNSPENLISWILDPKGINPLTAMPNLPIMQSEARDIAAYLYQNPGR